MIYIKTAKDDYMAEDIVLYKRISMKIQKKIMKNTWDLNIHKPYDILTSILTFLILF